VFEHQRFLDNSEAWLAFGSYEASRLTVTPAYGIALWEAKRFAELDYIGGGGIASGGIMGYYHEMLADLPPLKSGDWVGDAGQHGFLGFAVGLYAFADVMPKGYGWMRVTLKGGFPAAALTGTMGAIKQRYQIRHRIGPRYTSIWTSDPGL